MVRRLSHKKKTSQDLDIHFRQRCLERLGFIPLQKTLLEKLYANELEFVDKQSNSRSVFRLPKEYNSNFLLVYDNKRKCFVTILEDPKSIIEGVGNV